MAWNQDVEITSDIQLEHQGREYNFSYVPSTNITKSLYGSGGYVFVFDRENKLNAETGLTLDEFLELKFHRKFDLGSVGVDWVMYNANYEYVVHCAVEFIYSANGSYNMVTKNRVVLSFALASVHQYVLVILYLLFVLYTLVVTILQIRTQWIKINV